VWAIGLAGRDGASVGLVMLPWNPLEEAYVDWAMGCTLTALVRAGRVAEWRHLCRADHA